MSDTCRQLSPRHRTPSLIGHPQTNQDCGGAGDDDEQNDDDDDDDEGGDGDDPLELHIKYSMDRPESERDMFSSDSEFDKQMETEDGDHPANLLSLASSFCRYKEQRIGTDVLFEDHFSEDKFLPDKFSEMGNFDEFLEQRRRVDVASAAIATNCANDHLDRVTLDVMEGEDHPADVIRSSEDDRIVRERRCNYLQFIASLPKTCSPSICGTLSQNRLADSCSTNLTSIITSQSQTMGHEMYVTEGNLFSDSNHEIVTQETEEDEVEDEEDAQAKFDWSIDQLATLRPVEISFNERVFFRYTPFEDEHNTQEKLCKESEEFFSQERIARSPSTGCFTPGKVSKNSDQEPGNWACQRAQTPARKPVRSFAVVSQCDAIEFQPPAMTHTSTPCVTNKRQRKIFGSPDQNGSIQVLVESPNKVNRNEQKQHNSIILSPVRTQSLLPLSHRKFNVYTPMSVDGCSSDFQRRKKLFDENENHFPDGSGHESLLFDCSSAGLQSQEQASNCTAKRKDNGGDENDVSFASASEISAHAVPTETRHKPNLFSFVFSDGEEEEENANEHFTSPDAETSHCRTPRRKSRRLRNGSSLSSSLQFLRDVEDEEEEVSRRDKSNKSINLSAWFSSNYFSATSVQLDANESTSATTDHGEAGVGKEDSVIETSTEEDGDENLFSQYTNDAQQMDDKSQATGLSSLLCFLTTNNQSKFGRNQVFDLSLIETEHSLSPTQDSGCFSSQKKPSTARRKNDTNLSQFQDLQPNKPVVDVTRSQNKSLSSTFSH